MEEMKGQDKFEIYIQEVKSYSYDEFSNEVEWEWGSRYGEIWELEGTELNREIRLCRAFGPMNVLNRNICPLLKIRNHIQAAVGK